MTDLRLFLFCIVLCLGTVTIDGKCDDGWEYHDDENKCLKWFDELKTLKEARKACEGLSHGTKLFKITDGVQAGNFLRWTLLLNVKATNSIWLDYADGAVDDVYVHSHIVNPHRMPRYPDKECSSAVINSGNVKYWLFVECSNSYYNYICEQPEIDKLGEKVKIVLRYGKGKWKFEVPNFPHGTSSVEDSGPCPTGWKHTSDGDTNKCYRLYNDKTNFFTANQKCKKVTNGKGGLLKILSYDFYKVITKLVERAKASYRIGIQLRNGDFSFTEGASSSKFEFVNWMTWENGEYTNCFELYDKYGYWLVRRTFCGDPYTNAYICERPQKN